MKVRYRMPIIEYDEGEIELTETEEILLTEKYAKADVLESIAERIGLFCTGFLNSALEYGYAYIEEIEDE